MEIYEYKILEEIYISKNSYIFKSIDNKTKKSILIKLTKKEYPSISELRKFEKEFYMTKKLSKIDGVRNSNDLIKVNNKPLLILEYLEGNSLDKIIQKSKLDLELFFNLAIKIIIILDKIHKMNIIHKDIKPGNIIVTNNQQIKIIDFSISTELKKETQQIVSPSYLEGSLGYISPEQTGRMNRSIDYRTDYYSLGITFYELLTGNLPFNSKDPMKLIFSHLAEVPAPPKRINKNIPIVLSSIIMKLIEKNPEDRYQSLYGLKIDLEKCYQEYKTKKTISDFIIAKSDIKRKFGISEKLFGRKKEVKKIINIFLDSSKGNKNIIFIKGPSGIGKTKTINEIQKPIVLKRGFFILGKFDLLSKSVPYSAIIQALTDLIKQLLTENSNKINIWKKRILNKIKNIKIISNMVPLLEHIIGKQEDLISLPPAESQNRFIITIQNFISLFADKQHPLVLFIDDLQWADIASINVIEEVFNNIDLKYFLFIGSYRNNEVTQTSPLFNMMDNLINKKLRFENIDILPLNVNQISEMLIETFSSKKKDVIDLAKLIKNKTNGNPFFIKEFLKTLYDKKYITFNNQWLWDFNKIKESGITDNVITLMADNIKKLKPDTLQIIKIGSCFGNDFNTQYLEIAMQKSNEMINQYLIDAVNLGIIIKLDDYYKFTHDKVQEAAYSLILNEKKQRIHYDIGIAFLSKYESHKSNKFLFTIVNQLNKSKKMLTDKQKELMIELNFKAGIISKKSAAFDTACDFFYNGLELLPNEKWKNNYNNTIKYYIELAEIEYILTNYKEMEKIFDLILNKAKHILEKIKIYQIMASYYQGTMKFYKAISLGEEILNKIGITYLKLEDIDDIEIKKQMNRFKNNINQINIDDISSLQILNNNYIEEAIKLISNIAVAYWVTSRKGLLYQLLILANLTLEYGFHPAALFELVVLGAILCCNYYEFDIGYKLGKLAMKVNEKFKNKFFEAMTKYCYYVQLDYWKNPLEDALKKIKEIYWICIETGNLRWASYSINHYNARHLIVGTNLEMVKIEIDKWTPLHVKLKQDDAFLYYNIIKQTIYSLLGKTKSQAKLSGKFLNEDKTLESLYKNNFYGGIGFLFTWKLYYLSFMDNFEEALKIIKTEKAEEYITSSFGEFQSFMAMFFWALTITQNYKKFSKEEKNTYIKKCEELESQFKKWANYSENNFKYFYLLISAEINRIKNKKIISLKLFDEAISTAKKYKFVHLEALANETASKFYFSLGLQKNSDQYMKEAIYCYLKWGSILKVEKLSKKHPQVFDKLLRNDNSEEDFVRKTLSTISKKTNYDITSAFSLDINSIININKAILSELSLNEVLKKILKNIIENTGAQNCFLFLENKDKLLLEGEISIKSSEIIIHQSIPLEEFNNVPISIILYTFRTGENIIINNIEENNRFLNDKYLLKNNVKSILCLPIRYKERIIGVLYLENKKTSNIFTSNRILLLNIITSLAAISIENARLFDSLNQTYKEIEEKNIELENIIFISSHDLKSPIINISGFSGEILNELNEIKKAYKLKDIDKKSINKIIKNISVFLDYITTSAGKMENLLTGLNKLIKLGKSSFDIVKINVNDLIKNLLVNYKFKIKQMNINIEINSLPECYGDPIYISQVFSNLIDNAIKFMNPKKKGLIRITGKKEKNHSIYCIEDNGIGISEKYYKNIFQIYNRLNPDNDVKGEGIGLTIVKRIIDRHNGRIWISSKSGNGSKFYIELPNYQYKMKF